VPKKIQRCVISRNGPQEQDIGLDTLRLPDPKHSTVYLQVLIL